MQPVIEIQGLRKEYPGFTLQDLTLTIEEGTITGLVGANGAGKSTTLKLLLNLIRRDAGTVRIFGMDNLQKEREIKAQVGVVFDEPCFHEILSPRQVNAYMGALYPSWDPAFFRRLLDRFSLPETKVVKEFSRGMKMKLSIAAAMAHHPRLLLLDEPTSGLDPLVRDEILGMFLEYLQDEHHSIVLSSHITSDLEKVADTIALIDDGRLLFHEEKDRLKEQYVLLKGSAAQLEKLDPGLLIGVRKNEYGFEALSKSRRQAALAGLVAERPTIEEIMLFFTRGRKAGKGGAAGAPLPPR